jgi:hypothetical protein
VYCERCGATLRAVAGLHRAGEPYIQNDPRGAFIRCPQCGHENRQLTAQRLSEKHDQAS